MSAKLSLVSLVGAAALAGALSAQTPSPVIVTPTRVVRLGGLPPGQDVPPEVAAALAAAGAKGAAAGEQDPAKKAADQKASKRLKAFKKLVFDRRPSSILKAWAAPELKPYDPKEDGKKEDEKKEDETKGEKKEGSKAKSGDAKSGQAKLGGAPAGVAGPALTLTVAGSSSSGVRATRLIPVATSSAAVAPPPAIPTATGSGAMSAAQIQALIDKEVLGGTLTTKATPSKAAGAASPAVKAAATNAALEAKQLKREM